jgi:lysophospholipase L1-like esterase
MRVRREVGGALCALLVTACAAAAAGPDSSVPQVTTVDGVGLLPEPLSTLTPGTTVAPRVITTTTAAGTTTTALHAEGNRILLIGDSILASISHRYSDDACKALVPLGWQVEVDAEVSRGIEFGNEVLARRMKAGWDVGVVLLGTNYGGDANAYLRQLNKIITTLAPSPVVLITVGEYRPDMRDVNRTIRAIAEVYPDQVSVLDWNDIVDAYPTVVNVDGIHPSLEGRRVLAEAIADHVGRAPTSPGDCLDSVFHDDSAGSVNGSGSGSGGTQTTVRPGATTTTVKLGTTTTIKPGTTSTSVPGGSSTTVATTGTATTTPPPTTPTTPTTPSSSEPAGGSIVS